jgi:hypothetical protein
MDRLVICQMKTKETIRCSLEQTGTAATIGSPVRPDKRPGILIQHQPAKQLVTPPKIGWRDDLPTLALQIARKKTDDSPADRAMALEQRS